MFHECSSFLEEVFTILEKCREPLSLFSRLIVKARLFEKVCEVKRIWCLCLKDVQRKQERLCRIISTDTYPFLTAKFF